MAHRWPAFLVDTSALHRLSNPVVEARLRPMVEGGHVGTCAIVSLEVLYSARNARDYDELALYLSGLPDVPITPAVTRRCMRVQHALSRIGHHRLAVPDLIIAAAAELADLTVLHYDADYETIATVTGQPHEWVVERGTI